MNWFLRDTVFTGRSFRDYDTSLVWEWKIYYTVLRFSIRGGGGGGGDAPSRTGGVAGFWSVRWCAESSQGLGCGFHFSTS